MKRGLVFLTIFLFALRSVADDVAGVPTFVTDTTGAHSFDESINHQTGFTISQLDSRLKDLFVDGESELCGPTSLANIVPYLKFWRRFSFPNLRLVQDPLEGDYSQVVRDFAKRCHTIETGTTPDKMRSCIRQYFLDSGYYDFSIQVIGSRGSGANLRIVTINDIRNFIKKDYGIILEVDWFTYDRTIENWRTDKSGHYVAVVGYDYNLNWGDSKITLKIINPLVNYRLRNSNSRWDSISMKLYTVKPGIRHLPLTRYVLKGNDFEGFETKAFVRNIIGFIPQTN